MKGFLFGAVVFFLLLSAVLFSLRSGNEEDRSPSPAAQGDIYVCRGCGKEYIDRFPYTPPWTEYPAEMPAHDIADIEETFRNGSAGGATPVNMFQRVTGNLSDRDDVDFYSFTTDVAGGAAFSFSFDGSSHGYAYLWDGTVYGTDGTTVLNSENVPTKEGEEVIFSTGEFNLEPGTYYLKISVASGGNPFLNGYSNTDYHIIFRPKCAEHTGVKILTTAPSCTRAGELITICSVCEEQISTESLEPINHIWSTWKPAAEESFFCSIYGDYSRVCALCGEKETDTLLFYFLDAPSVVQETCTECGYTNMMERNGSRWILPVIITIGGVATVGVLFIALRVVRRRRWRTSKRRQRRAFKNIKLFGTKFTCPFCIREYDKSEVLYVCPDCGKSSQPGKFEKEPIECKNPRCSGLATLRKCPSCGQVIPKTALETPNLAFSIVGVSNSGKTNYITVMLHELEKSSGLRLVLGHQTKETLDRQSENFHRIYEEHTRPESTQASEITPQIWYIKNLIKKRRGKVPTYTFTIFDGAGEDHENNLDSSSTVCRYINASKAIILTIDPLVLSTIRNSGVVDQDVLINSLGGYRGETKNAKDVINSVATYIKAARGIKATKMLDIPVAVVLTKFDTLMNQKAFGPQALIRNRSLTVRNGKIDMTEIKQVDQEIRNWLYEIEEGAFIDTLDSHFKEYYFFGVSSYGAPPKDAHTLSDEIRPHRVLDPILWLFKREKFID